MKECPNSFSKCKKDSRLLILGINPNARKSSHWTSGLSPRPGTGY